MPKLSIIITPFAIEEKMKKILTIALVALLATASVFAGLSGKAKLALGYDFENGNYGFSNGKEFALTMNIAEETKESVAEGDILRLTTLLVVMLLSL